MNISPLVLPPKRSGGFTLIELLVVVAIVIILVAVLFPVLGAVQNSGRKVQVTSDMRNMKVSLISYYTDYRKYPVNATQQSAADYEGDDTVYGDPGATPLYKSVDLFNILRAISDDRFNQNNQLNPSLQVYWQGQLVKNPNNPRNGITSVDVNVGGITLPKGSFVDSWGNTYVVWLDAGKDGDLTTATGWFYSDIANGPKDAVHPGDPPMGMEFGSLGPDGKWGTKGNGVLKGSDDIVTW